MQVVAKLFAYSLHLSARQPCWILDLDDTASSNVAVNAQGNSVLNGNISGNLRKS